MPATNWLSSGSRRASTHDSMANLRRPPSAVESSASASAASRVVWTSHSCSATGSPMPSAYRSWLRPTTSVSNWFSNGEFSMPSII